jgi:hypothetical protein
VFLESHPGYYRRFGVRAGGELGFRTPSLRIPDDAFQALPMPSYEPWMSGTLIYSHVFWEHDAVGLPRAGCVMERALLLPPAAAEAASVNLAHRAGGRAEPASTWRLGAVPAAAASSPRRTRR